MGLPISGSRTFRSAWRILSSVTKWDDLLSGRDRPPPAVPSLSCFLRCQRGKSPGPGGDRDGGRKEPGDPQGPGGGHPVPVVPLPPSDRAPGVRSGALSPAVAPPEYPPPAPPAAGGGG